MKKIIAISGSGQGAGKTTLANKLKSNVVSIASGIRKELAEQHPGYDWYNKSQDYKDTTIVHELNMTVRDALFTYGQQVCTEEPIFWVRRLVNEMKETGETDVAVDDVRKLCELRYLRNAFPHEVLHVHVIGIGAIKEKAFENDDLHAIADYVVEW